MDFISDLLENKVKKDEKTIQEDIGVVDMAPYQVQNINNFYFRDHPENLNPNTPKYKKYWYNFAVDSVEGKWVYDEDTWYWMPPKLFFLCNYSIISDKKKNPIHPHMRDLERIIMRYVTCADGFSGFEDDYEYTCNHLVKQAEAGTLPARKRRKLTDNCFIKGTDKLKTYVHPWTYLMRHYLIDNKQDRPLGRALWENGIKNMMILGGRFTGKSSAMFVGDFMHEWFFGGVKRKEQLSGKNGNRSETQKDNLFGMASTDSAAVNRSLASITGAMSRLKGSYTFPNLNGENTPKYMGPYYKNYTGSWAIGKEVRHQEKDRNGNITHKGAIAQMRVITPDKTKIFAGDRFRRIYIEEAGFVGNLMEIHANQKDTLQLFDERVGSAVYLGTSGEIDEFVQVNEIFVRPETYDIQDIPNYWSQSGKNIGLFVPAYYTRRDFANEHQNINIVEALADIISYRERYKKEAAAAMYDKEVMFHPIEPKEMIRPSGTSVLPKQEAQDRLSYLEDYDVVQKIASIGWLEYDKRFPGGVGFKIDIKGELDPIMSYSVNSLRNTKGAFIQYEMPEPNPPKDLYWVLYDPAAQSGEGASFHSVLVYKYSFSGNSQVMEDTIVGEWLGRLPTLEDNWNMVVKIAKYFGAKIFPEYNTPGFLDWCKDKKHFGLLQPENVNLKREMNPKAKMSAWRKGFRMDTRIKGWSLNKLADWLVTPIEFDDQGIPTKKVIDTILSTRLLEEIVYFDPNGNYDHLSSALGLMILQDSLKNIEKPKLIDSNLNYDYLYKADEVQVYETPYVKKTRGRLSKAKLLNF